MKLRDAGSAISGGVAGLRLGSFGCIGSLDAQKRALQVACSILSCPFKREYSDRKFYMEKGKTISGFQLHDKDTGSADVQVALLTDRINHLTEHLQKNIKDHSSRRGLLKMVGQRRRLLDYLHQTDLPRYQAVTKKLKLRH